MSDVKPIIIPRELMIENTQPDSFIYKQNLIKVSPDRPPTVEPAVLLSEVLELLREHEKYFEDRVLALPHLAMSAGVHKTRAAFCRKLVKQLIKKYGANND
jgi:hypothetical protein